MAAPLTLPQNSVLLEQLKGIQGGVNKVNPIDQFPITIGGSRFIVAARFGISGPSMGILSLISSSGKRVAEIDTLRGALSGENDSSYWNLDEEGLLELTGGLYSTLTEEEKEILANPKNPNSQFYPANSSLANYLPNTVGIPEPLKKAVKVSAAIPGIIPLEVIPSEPTSNPVQPVNPGQGQEPRTQQGGGSQGLALRYPIKMTGEQDTISFRAVEYFAKGGNIGTLNDEDFFNTFTFGERPLPGSQGRAYSGGVTLAIQSPISDLNSVDWSGGTINALEAFGVNAALKLMGSSTKDITRDLAEIADNVFDAARANQGAMLTYLAQEAIGVQNLQSRLQGQILNPNLELLFSGPQLRPFNFSFKLSAREPAEAVAIRRIINYFKYHMAPRAKDKLFLKAPYTFEIKYNGVGSLAIGQVKECALLSFGVDYTPLGSYATYKDGTMVQYNINMQFQELEPVTDIDQEPYKDSTTIGY